MKNPLIAGFVEIQHEPKTFAWNGKTTEGQASPCDCHKTAQMMSDEELYITTHHFCSMHLWNLVLNFSSASIFIFNFNDDDAM
jgi:hypothetical protein